MAFHTRALLLWLLAFLAPTDATLAADYRLPFHGRWFVMSGGDTINVNHHMSERSQWFGVDFMKTGGATNRSVAKNGGKSLEDFYSWGQPVLAPCDGVVHTVHDGEPDNEVGKRHRTNAFGNYVVLEAGPKEFVFLAHLRKGSIAVKEGQKVTAGTELGKCGNSGNTDGPHIHMHVQNHGKPYNGSGQNVTFQGIHVVLAGKHFAEVDWPLIQGLFVWHEESP